MTNGAPKPPQGMTLAEFARFRDEAQKLREKYSAEREAYFFACGRTYHENPKPGRPR